MGETMEAGRERRMVYVVRAGEYSDTWTVGVYTKPDHADAVARAKDGYVEDFEIDPALDEDAVRHLRPGERLYQVLMRRDGQEARAWPQWSGDADMYLSANYAHHNIVGRCWATSEEHAIKIVNDRRIAWLAAGSPLSRAKQHGWADAPDPRATPNDSVPEPSDTE